MLALRELTISVCGFPCALNASACFLNSAVLFPVATATLLMVLSSSWYCLFGNARVVANCCEDTLAALKPFRIFSAVCSETCPVFCRVVTCLFHIASDRFISSYCEEKEADITPYFLARFEMPCENLSVFPIESLIALPYAVSACAPVLPERLSKDLERIPSLSAACIVSPLKAFRPLSFMI